MVIAPNTRKPATLNVDAAVLLELRKVCFLKYGHLHKVLGKEADEAIRAHVDRMKKEAVGS